MSEFIGLATTEVRVLFDVQRVGPPPHADAHPAVRLLLCAYASHGDTKHVLLPVEPEECFYMA